MLLLEKNVIEIAQNYIPIIVNFVQEKKYVLNVMISLFMEKIAQFIVIIVQIIFVIMMENVLTMKQIVLMNIIMKIIAKSLVLILILIVILVLEMGYAPHVKIFLCGVTNVIDLVINVLGINVIIMEPVSQKKKIVLIVQVMEMIAIPLVLI